MIFGPPLLRLLAEDNEIGKLPVEIILLIRDMVNKEVFNEGSTVSLMLNAAEEGYHVCLRLLMEAGYDLGQANRNGQTPAHLAASNGHEEAACARAEGRLV